MPAPSTRSSSRPTSPLPSATPSATPRLRDGRAVSASPRDTARGIFVTIEGPDFSGKSTLVRALEPLLASSDPPTHFTREPGGTPVAELFRGLLLDPAVEMDAWTEAYLYAAARADQAWRYVTYLTVGYLISRGLAKAGSRKPYKRREDVPK